MARKAEDGVNFSRLLGEQGGLAGQISGAGSRKPKKRTVSFKVSDEDYEVYRLYAKYYGADRLNSKWRDDIRRIAETMGDALRQLERQAKTLEENRNR